MLSSCQDVVLEGAQAMCRRVPRCVVRVQRQFVMLPD